MHTPVPALPGPGELLAKHACHPVVIVAAAGGGIQSAAWTTRVLSGLQQDLSGAGFDRSISVISGVSGGSVGAMYFADAYRPDGTLPAIGPAPAGHDALEDYAPVAAAESSSLESVTFGLAYPDLVWGVVPFFRGISLEDRAIVNGRNLTNNRGTWLDRAFMRTDGLKSATMSQWTADTIAARRPAIIFNSTLVETGERMLMSTSRLEDSASGETTAEHYGRRYFNAMYPGSDLAVVTAARLRPRFRMSLRRLVYGAAGLR